MVTPSSSTALLDPPPGETALIIPPDSTLGTRSEAVEAMTARRFRIPGDKVAEAVRDLPEAQRAVMKWFHGYCHARNLGEEACSQLLLKPNGQPYSWASIYAALTGRRSDQGVSVDGIATAMEAFRRKVEAQTRVGDGGFIETRLSKAIWARCHRARKRRKIAFVFGPSQIGKSESLAAYTAAHNHGSTVLIEAPTGGSITGLLEELCEVMAIPQIHRQGDLRKRIIACFDPSMLLIVDEAHRLLHYKRGMLSLEFLRELYNKAGCGMVLAMTDEGKGFFLGQGGKNPFGVRLKQLWNRRITPLNLPKMLPADDLDLFSAAYKLDAAPREEVAVTTKFFDEEGQEQTRKFKAVPRELEAKVCSEEGLGVWLTILQDAKDMAEEQKRAISWPGVLKAYCASQADLEVWG